MGEVPSANKPIEGVGTGIVDLGPEGPDIPVVVLVVASAIGAGISVLLARKSKRRERVVQLPGLSGENKTAG